MTHPVIERLLGQLHAAEARPGEWVIFGSTVMLLHGLREDVGDVDIFVTRSLWSALRVSARGTWAEQRPHPTDPPFLEWIGFGMPVHAFYAWTPRDQWVSAEESLAAAEQVQGLPCIPLSMVARHKHDSLAQLAAEGVEVAGTRWEKHRRDLALLADVGVKAA